MSNVTDTTTGPGYRRALKQMIFSSEPFSFEEIRSRNGISHVSSILREFGWLQGVKGKGGSIWIGPTPKDDAELDDMVDRVRGRLREIDKGRREMKKKESMERDYNAYCRLIDRIARGQQGFDTEQLTDEFEAYGQVAGWLRDLHWVKARKGSDLEFWIGPVINTEEDLHKAVRFLMQQMDKQIPEQQEPTQGVPEEVLGTPSVITDIGPAVRISVLWGLFKYERSNG